jgi:putative ABC transport system ATP-binding protein
MGIDLLAGPAPAAVEVSSLHRFFRTGGEETLALRGVTFAVQAGELVAVVGPSGSGKSTLLACMAGLDEPDGGSVTIAGERMSGRPEQARATLRARSVGFVFQNGNLVEHLTVAANVALVQRLTGRPARVTADELLGSVGLHARARAHPRTLSGGESARAGLAVALANDPVVVLADEPTGELDGAAEESIIHLLLDAADRGTAVVVASHSTAVAAAADRVIRLEDGARVS